MFDPAVVSVGSMSRSGEDSDPELGEGDSSDSDSSKIGPSGAEDESAEEDTDSESPESDGDDDGQKERFFCSMKVRMHMSTPNRWPYIAVIEKVRLETGRSNGGKRRRKAGRLAELMKMPMDIFFEVHRFPLASS